MRGTLMGGEGVSGEYEGKRRRLDGGGGVDKKEEGMR